MPAPSTRIELVGNCVGPDGHSATHRVWLTRDSDVVTPDHADGYDHEKVVTALGGNVVNLCATWRRTAANIGHPNADLGIRAYPNRTLLTWQYTQESLWRAKSQWIANSALLGVLEFRPIPPPTALNITKLFLDFGALMPPPKEWADMLYLFTVPSSRQAAWRRSWPARLADIDALLRSGLDPMLVADAAALDIPAAVAGHAITVLSSKKLPHSWLLAVASLMSPNELQAALTRWQGLPPDVVRREIAEMGRDR